MNPLFTTFIIVLALWLVGEISCRADERFVLGTAKNGGAYYHNAGEKTATVTAYCDGTVCADGTAPVPGITVAAPRSVPFGTVVHIEGVGFRTVHDRTSKKFDGRWDVFFKTRAEALKFGKQKLIVRIIKNKSDYRKHK